MWGFNPAVRAWPLIARIFAAAAGCALISACADGDGEGAGTATSAPRIVTIARDVERGTHAVAEASSSIAEPVALKIRVSSVPRSTVSVAYGLTCAGAATQSGGYETGTPATRNVTLPREARQCEIHARAELLAPSGSVTVTLLAAER